MVWLYYVPLVERMFLTHELHCKNDPSSTFACLRTSSVTRGGKPNCFLKRNCSLAHGLCLKFNACHFLLAFLFLFNFSVLFCCISESLRLGLACSPVVNLNVLPFYYHSQTQTALLTALRNKLPV